MNNNKAGISMCGTIVNAKRPGLIPCDCKKCYHKRRPKGGGSLYCDYYKVLIDNRRKMCARYSGPDVKTSKLNKGSNNNSKASKTCKKCGFYDYKSSFCKQFEIPISSTSTGMYCKKYQEAKSKVPKKYKYKHSSSNKKWNKYKLKK